MAVAPKAVFANYLTPYSEIQTYSCTDSLPLSKGTLVQLHDPYTASKALAWTVGGLTTSGAFLGIVTSDKEASDGATTVSVLKIGRADIRASGAITVGQTVICAGNDEVMAIPILVGSDASSRGLVYSMAVGTAEETASDGEVIIVRFNK